MFIKSIKMSFFKGFSSEGNELSFNLPDGETIGSGLNIFIGENNTGKSTVFEAISFLRDEVKDINIIKSKLADGTQSNDALVELTFKGNINTVIENFAPSTKKEALRDSIFNVDELMACRSTENCKELKLWKDGSYQNITGIAAPFKKLFENNFIWADTNPSDEASFGASTMCGVLLKEIAAAHTGSEEYQQFTEQFNIVFNNPNSELRQEIAEIESKIQTVFTEQFGHANIKFKFDNLDISSYFKNIDLIINDGVETAMSEKGHGMQRAVALALLQVYAETIAHSPDQEVLKPFFLFIDEPEICLHPKGQKKLLEALLQISKNKQVFLTTHSPYFLISPHLNNAGLFIFSNDETDTGKINKVRNINVDGIFPWSPTWGEINFKAYNLPTVEFHNELYGFLQIKSNQSTERQFEQWLVSPPQSLSRSKSWQRDNGNPAYPVTLQTFIRNHIHHPENTIMQNQPYTHEELEKSIKEMLEVLSRLP